MSTELLPNNESQISLRGMVDIALGTPEVGSVNFNMLHTLLHALISKFDLDNTMITLLPDATANVISISTTPFHLLQDRINVVEKQINDLNSLPSNKEILNVIFGVDNTPTTEPDNKRLASDLWQALTIRKKVAANEEGIDRLSSLIDSVLGEISKLRADNEAMKQKIEDMENQKGIGDNLNKLQNDFDNLLAEFNKLKDKVTDYPNDEFFKNIVTWEALEKALRGIKDELDDQKVTSKIILVNMTTEDDKLVPVIKKGTSSFEDKVVSVVEENAPVSVEENAPASVEEKIDTSLDIKKDPSIEEKADPSVEKVEGSVEDKTVEDLVVDQVAEKTEKQADKTYEAYLEWSKDSCHLKLPLPVDDMVNAVNRLIEDGQISANITEGADDVLFNIKIPLKDVQSKEKSDRKMIWKIIPKSNNVEGKVKHEDEIEINIPLTKSQLLQAGVNSIPNTEAIEGIDYFIIDIPINDQKVIDLIVIKPEPTNRPPNEMFLGPSDVCAEMLEKLGNLTVAHYLLDARVVVLEEEMPNKADKKDLEKFKFPDDFMITINNLKAQVELLMSAKNKDFPVTMNMDGETLSKIRELLNGLQNKMTELNEIVDKVANENKDLLKQIEELFLVTTDHESRKADIGYLDGQLMTKADKSLVDSKVNFSVFDETTGNLHNLINDVLRKLLAFEEELRNILKSMALDINCKVDKDDLIALKEWIEKRLRALSDKFKNLRGFDTGDDDAAGFKKQLLQHFHCISCDRPVDLVSQGLPYANGLPDPRGLPPAKSIRPYTTFEMDAMRQQNKGNKNVYVQNHTKRYGSDIVDVYQTPRPCGGSHTTTYSHKKMIRSGNLNNSNYEEDVVIKGIRDELDLQGADGHIYKGRLDRTQTLITSNVGYSEQTNFDKLPPVPTNQRSQTVMSNNNLTPRGATVSTRPKSALKLTPRPSTSGCNSNSRPESARQPSNEPDSRPTTPIRNNSENFNLIDQETNHGDQVLLTSNNYELEIVSPENNAQNGDDNVLY